MVIVGAALAVGSGAAARAAHAADELLRIPPIVVAVVVGVVIVIAAGGVVWQFRQARLLDGPGVGSRADRLPSMRIPPPARGRNCQPRRSRRVPRRSSVVSTRRQPRGARWLQLAGRSSPSPTGQDRLHIG
ncbi:MAG TPA: hypothetical protein VMA73_12560 [Streptosporangiaceae bacterium]|nr:hypothetical protein [Streptosporangiaceae bacterium]